MKKSTTKIEINRETIERYIKAKEAKREYEMLDKLLKAEIKASATESLNVDGYTLTLSHTDKYMLDQKALKAALPEAWEEFGVHRDYTSIQIND